MFRTTPLKVRTSLTITRYGHHTLVRRRDRRISARSSTKARMIFATGMGTGEKVRPLFDSARRRAVIRRLDKHVAGSNPAAYRAWRDQLDP